MGIEIHSDLYGSMYFKDLEGNPLPTAAAMLRDRGEFVCVTTVPNFRGHLSIDLAQSRLYTGAIYLYCPCTASQATH